MTTTETDRPRGLASSVPILWVEQEDAWGCAAACMAMLTRRTYREIVDSVGGLGEEKRRSMLFFWGQWLTEQGYALAYKHKFFDNVQRDPWPPEPFSAVHVAEVVVSDQSRGSHCVVLLDDGAVLDPLTAEKRRLSDYSDVYFVAAVASLA